MELQIYPVFIWHALILQPILSGFAKKLPCPDSFFAYV